MALGGLLSGLFGRQQGTPGAALPGILAPQSGGILGISGPTLMALGAGLASGDDWGEGIGRGLGLAADVKQQEQARETQIAPLRESYQALIASGMSPQEALLNTMNPAAAKTLQDRKDKAAWQKMLLGGGGATTGGSETTAYAPAGGSYEARLASAESGGSATARNPNSSATGIYQFTEPTWQAMMRKYPALGLTAEGMTDPAQQEKAQSALKGEHTAVLKRLGMPVNDQTLYAMHFLGSPDASKVLKAPDDQPVSSYVASESVAANPFLEGMTVGDFKQWAAGKMGGTAVAPPPAVVAQSAADGLSTLNPQQRSILAAAGPDKGLPLLASFLTDNAKTARDTAEKQRALTATASMLMAQVPGMTPDQAVSIAVAGQAGPFLTNAMKQPPGVVGEFLAAQEQGVLPEGMDLQGYVNMKKGQGFSVTTPDGTVVQYGNQAGGAGLAKPTVNKVQEKAFSTSEAGGRLSAIKASFKPEYQTLGTRFSNMWSAGVAKLNPDLLSADDRQALTNFAEFRSAAMDNLNQVLKEMSGAAVTPQEFERIKQVLPNPGTGLFDGDDPVTFQAKMNRALNEAHKALVRYEFYQKTNRLPGGLDQIPLANIKMVEDGVWMVKDGEDLYEVRL